MKSKSRTVLFSLLALASAPAAFAGVAEAARSAASAANGVASKVDGAIRRGLQSASDSGNKASKAADAPVDRAAKKMGVPRGANLPPTENER